MMRLLLISILLTGVFAADGTRAWREADRAFQSGEYARAAQGYQEALNQPDLPDARRHRLAHNLGVALHQLGRHDEAVRAFERAGAAAESRTDRSRAAYNAGTAAMAQGDFASAVDLLRKSVTLDPRSEDARHNFELALRSIPPEDQSESMMDGDDSEPSGDSDESEEEQDNGDEGQEGETETEGDEGDEADDEEGDSEPELDSGEDGPDQPEPSLSREQAERLLQALEQGEDDIIRNARKAPPPQRRIERDW
jgi:Ca-activated chloride channel homolog